MSGIAIAGKSWLKTVMMELALLALEGHRDLRGRPVHRVSKVNLGHKGNRDLKAIPATKGCPAHRGNRGYLENKDCLAKLGLKVSKENRDHPGPRVTRETLEHFRILCKWDSVS
jgi:hypothetical protein